MEKEQSAIEGDAGRPEDPRSVFQRAEDLLHNNRCEEAIGICRTGVERFPDFLPGRLLLGRCCLEAGRISESRTQLEIVAGTVEACSSVYKVLSRVYLEERQVEKAMEALQKALFLTWGGPGVPGAEREKAVSAPQRGDVKQHPFLAEKAAKAPAQPIRTDTLADIYLRQGHIEKALSVLEEILERDPANAAARRKYDAVLTRKGGEPKKDAREKVLLRLDRWLAVVRKRADASSV